ncbi:hypothetical protein IM40_06460 [Candidatus Paracaedimonas acanthamoebae]|nr:hypothetical protein IM40_06460 [Candidatus Paracaedimonas acanthamoebae]
MHAISKIGNVLFLINLIIGSFSLYASSIQHEYSSEDDASGSRSRSSSVSNYSDGIFKGSFEEYLRQNRLLDRFKRYDQEDIEWRKTQRESYLEEMITILKTDCLDPTKLLEMGILQDESAHSAATIQVILENIHRSADKSFPEDLFDGENNKSVGTYRHTFCKKYIEAIQQETGYLKFLLLEYSYLMGETVPSGTKGSVRPDVYWLEKGIAFDYKNWDAIVSDLDTEKGKQHIPNFKRLIQINP